MAVLRNTPQLNNSMDYLSTLAIFVCVTTLITMLKFLGFKASLNLSSGRNDTNPDATTMSVTGAYRVNRDEFLDDVRTTTNTRDIRSPPIARPQTNPANPNLRPNKSTSDLVKQKNLPAHLSISSHEISFDPRGGTSAYTNRNTTVVDENIQAKNNQSKLSREQIKLEKKRMAEQKAKEKAVAQEQMKQEKLRKEQEKVRKEQEKQEARQREKEQVNAKNKKKAAPAAHPAPPMPQNIKRAANPANPTSSYSTNTMQSSISTTSGPPPYSEPSKPQPETVSSSTPNVMFSKPIEDSSNSWDLISQHRQQMSRPVPQGRLKAEKKMVMDLQYRMGDDNSEV